MPLSALVLLSRCVPPFNLACSPALVYPQATLVQARRQALQLPRRRPSPARPLLALQLRGPEDKVEAVEAEEAHGRRARERSRRPHCPRQCSLSLNFHPQTASVTEPLDDCADPLRRAQDQLARGHAPLRLGYQRVQNQRHLRPLSDPLPLARRFLPFLSSSFRQRLMRSLRS